MPLKQYQQYIVAIVPILLLGIVAYYFIDIVTYVVLAWILSMIGAPLHNRLKKLIGNSGGAIVTLLSFSVITFVLFWLFIPPVIQQARNFANIDYEQVATSLEEPINDWNEWLVNKGILEESNVSSEMDELNQEKAEKSTIEIVQLDSIINSQDSITENITILVQVNHPSPQEQAIEKENLPLAQTYLERVKGNVLNFLNPTRISNILSTIFGALGNTLIGVMSVFFITFFFLKEQGLFSSIIKSISPNKQEDKWVGAIDESANLLKRYFIGVVLQVMIIAIFVSLTLSVLGFKNALLIGFFAALMNVIPYLGPLLGAAFAVIITITSSLDNSDSDLLKDLSNDVVNNSDGNFYDVLLPKIGILLLVFGAMQLLDNFVLQPNIFSKSVKAHPLEIFIVILIGAKMGGILGMIIAIPLYTILRVLAKVFLSEFKIVQRITQRL